jgi:predicted acyl esterase
VSSETHLVAATNVIYHDASRPSRIILPVVPAE